MNENVKFKLPVIKILAGAFYMPWAYRNALARALVVPAFFGVLFFCFIWLNLGTGYSSWFMFIAVWLITGLLYSLFAVTCHRVILLGVESVPVYGILKITKREMFFILAVVGLSVLSTLFMAGISIIVQLPLNIANLFLDNKLSVSDWFVENMQDLYYLLQLFVFSRFGLILPAVAVDQRTSLKWSWRITKGNTVRLMIIMGVSPLAVVLLSYLIPSDYGLPGYAFYALLWWTLLPIQIAALSLSYRELEKKNTGTDDKI